MQTPIRQGEIEKGYKGGSLYSRIKFADRLTVELTSVRGCARKLAGGVRLAAHS